MCPYHWRYPSLTDVCLQHINEEGERRAGTENDHVPQDRPFLSDGQAHHHQRHQRYAILVARARGVLLTYWQTPGSWRSARPRATRTTSTCCRSSRASISRRTCTRPSCEHSTVCRQARSLTVCAPSFRKANIHELDWEKKGEFDCQRMLALMDRKQ